MALEYHSMKHKRRRVPLTPLSPAQPQYEWALDMHGLPVHICNADRGEMYTCPVCHGKMIAKRGEIKQHHFAHDQLQACTPEAVARVAARRWLVMELQRMVHARQGIMLTWPCALCKKTHTANLLHDIDLVMENYVHDDVVSDVALLDDNRITRAVIALNRPTPDALLAYAQQNIMALVVNATGRDIEFSGIESFLAGASIYGGLCTTQRTAAEEGLITDNKELRVVLTAAVAQPPHHIYGALEEAHGLTHVFTLGDRKLWLPPILWQRAIGGLHHTINPALQIITQEWEQPDGATIALYYVTAKETSAIAVRRFAPGETVYAKLQPGALHGPRMTALSVARSFAEV